MADIASKLNPLFDGSALDAARVGRANGSNVEDALGTLFVGSTEPFEYELSGYSEFVADQNFRVLTATDRTGRYLIENMFIAAATADAAGKAAQALSQANQNMMALGAYAPLGMVGAPSEYERSGYSDFVADQNYRVLSGIDASGVITIGGLRIADIAVDAATKAAQALAAIATLAPLGLAPSALEYERSGYIEFIADQNYRALSAIDNSGRVMTENFRAASAAVLPVLTDNGGKVLTVKPDGTGTVWATPAGSAGGVLGRLPRIVVAAANAPAYQKNAADYVCTGVKDDEQIQMIMDNAPLVANFERSHVGVTGARGANLQFTEGSFALSKYFQHRPGNVFGFYGGGTNSWRGGDPSLNQWEGGTMFYCTDPTGRIYDMPQWTGYRTEPGRTTEVNTIPASYLNMSGIDFRVFNPASNQNTYAMNFDGFQAGVIESINVSADRSTNASAKIGGAVSMQTGARTDKKTLRDVSVCGFRDYGFNINTTHLEGDHLVATTISGGASAAAFAMTGDVDNTFRGLHAFGATVALKTFGLQPVAIDQMMIESCSTPLLIASGGPDRVYFDRLDLNHDVPFTGDIATKAVIRLLIRNEEPLIRIDNNLRITISAGSTSASLAHNLIATPKSEMATIRGSTFTPFGASSDATLTTVYIPAPLATDVTFNVYVTASA